MPWLWLLPLTLARSGRGVFPAFAALCRGAGAVSVEAGHSRTVRSMSSQIRTCMKSTELLTEKASV